MKKRVPTYHGTLKNNADVEKDPTLDLINVFKSTKLIYEKTDDDGNYKYSYSTEITKRIS